MGVKTKTRTKTRAVIMAGGSGTRFWPRSSAKMPKQFLSLTGRQSLLQLTAQRLRGIVSPAQMAVVSVESQRQLIKKHLPAAQLITEPIARNTMAAIGLSVWSIVAHAAGKIDDPVVIVVPADAYIVNVKEYQQVLRQAINVAANDSRIVCVGIKPRFPATGYGYIEVGDSLPSNEAYGIKRFIEKPDPATAKDYYESGRYLWNAGIFIFKASTLINEMRRLQPDTAKVLDQYVSLPTAKKKGYLKTTYETLAKLPFDIGIMEKTQLGAVIPGDFGWSDLGSWPSLRDVLSDNHRVGLVTGPARVLDYDCKNIIVSSEASDTKLTIGLVGLSDLIVVKSGNQLLICAADRAEDVKKIAES